MPLRTARRDLRLISELLTTAEIEARALGDPEPGAEHLLLAAVAGTDASARDSLGVDADAVRAALIAVHAESLASIGVVAPELDTALPPVSGVYRSQVSAQEVFQRARELSRRSPSGLRTAHVLLAVTEREHGTAARVLRRLGLERASVADAAMRVLAT